MATTLVVNVKVAWWLSYYLEALIFFCQLFGTEPDWQKLQKMLIRSVSVYDARTGRRIA